MMHLKYFYQFIIYYIYNIASLLNYTNHLVDAQCELYFKPFIEFDPTYIKALDNIERLIFHY